MNTVIIEFMDKKSRMGRISVNHKPVGVGQDRYDEKYHWMIVLANDWNMSNPITFHAATIKGLAGQIRRHRYSLRKYVK